MRGLGGGREEGWALCSPPRGGWCTGHERSAQKGTSFHPSGIYYLTTPTQVNKQLSNNPHPGQQAAAPGFTNNGFPLAGLQSQGGQIPHPATAWSQSQGGQIPHPATATLNTSLRRLRPPQRAPLTILLAWASRHQTHLNILSRDCPLKLSLTHSY